MDDLTYFIETYVRMFLASSPLAVMPIYVSMTPGYTHKERLSVSFKSCHIAFGILLFAAITGNAFLKFIGISLDAFKVAGGVVLFLIGVELLKSKAPDEQVTEAEIKEAAKGRTDITVTPLAFPIIVGPGCISALLISQGEAITGFHSLLAYVAAFSIMATFYILFYITSTCSKVINKSLINLSSRLSGLVLIALASEFIIAGIRGLLGC